MPTKKKRPVPVTKKTRAEDVTPEQAKANLFEQTMSQYIEADRTRAEAQKTMDAAKDAMKEMLAELPEEENSIQGVKGTATLVTSSTTTIDETYLVKHLPQEVWEQVTTRTLDKDLFKKAVVDGAVESSVVNTATTTKPRKPYVKVTVR